MSPRSPVLKPREVLRALLRAGFEIIIKPAPTFNYDTPTSRISELPYLATTNFDPATFRLEKYPQTSRDDSRRFPGRPLITQAGKARDSFEFLYHGAPLSVVCDILLTCPAHTNYRTA
jgi:hypothetical protein